MLLAGIGRTYERKATVVTDQDIRIVLSEAVEVSASKSMPRRVECTPPGSKSISNRALILAALGQGQCCISNLLHSDDTEVMMNAISRLKGASFAWEDDGKVLVVTGNGGRLQASDDDLYLGNAGTASRFLTSVATLAEPTSHDSSVLTGNERMKVRPIGPLVDALTGNGAMIDYLQKVGSLPLKIKASNGMEGGDINLAATVSSQYVSSIMMSAPYAKKAVTIRLTGTPISQPYIDMTTAMMASFGIEVKKSTKEAHTYYIPQGVYTNPSRYEIESDASSATYPLGIAAINGTTCTVPNIGFSSLQGDARFAMEVLKPMGCVVDQTATSTTVTGPPKGSLRPIPNLDMEPMTDAFLTASVLAAVARHPQGAASTTHITGIANQRVKECNRIQAMEDQLGQFGVTSRQFPDGIEIDGIDYENLKRPVDGVECYDDHRVAMSLSILGTIAPHGALIREKDCVGKTWPGWWDTLRSPFGIMMNGIDLAVEAGEDFHGLGNEKSVLLIGMRGAGKTTTGGWIADILGWPFTDLDTKLEEQEGHTIPEIIHDSGWEGFRSLETSTLQRVLKEKPQRQVVACGGGIVETQEAREILQAYHRAGGLVILVERSIEDIISYLQVDQTRPAYVEDMRAVWERRREWYCECSNYQHYSHYQHYSQRSESKEIAQNFKDLDRFIRFIKGQRPVLDRLKKKERSFFVSLTVPDITKALQFLPRVAEGSDAVELRVDLLEDPSKPGMPPSKAFVTNQLSILRRSIDLPVIFTIRTQSQGGKFPDTESQQLLALSLLALRMGVEFLDLEMQLCEDILSSITKAKGQTSIIASHHDIKGTLSWANGSWVSYYNKALLHGDVIKLVGLARKRSDNIELLQFRDWATAAHKTPLIAINMKPEGQLSRIQNAFLTPVTHPELPFKAAPGQLSAAEIRTALTLHGEIKPTQFYLFGKPISQSKSPALHNTLFKSNGLPHHYTLYETDQAAELKKIIRSDDFGGASVTIPLKLDVMPLMDSVSTDARIIGAVNTIVVESPKACNNSKLLVGQNTDWKGMRLVLEATGAQGRCGKSAMVVGGGGTARAALFALRSMGYSPLYLLGRSPQKLQELVREFPDNYQIQIVCPTPDAKTIAETRPSVVIGTVPADEPIDAKIEETLRNVFKQDEGQEAVLQDHKVLLEMAYKPSKTSLMRLAQDAGWETIPGLAVLAAQGVYQFKAWTGISPCFEHASVRYISTL